MTEEKPKDELKNLRQNLENAPTLGESTKTGTEIKVRRSPWVVRSLILVLVLLFAGEMYFIKQYQKEAQHIIVNDPPAVNSYSAPEISAPLPPPPIEAVSANDFVPEPTPIPLPPELAGIEIPPADE